MADQNASDNGAPSLIPVPPDFHFEWETPDQERAFWQQDVMHFPEPVTPIMGDLFNGIFNEGFEGASQAYELPVRLAFQRLNTYNYNAIILRVPPDQVEAQGHKAEEKLKQAVAEFVERWNNEWLPEVKKYSTDWDSFDLRGASNSALLLRYYLAS